MSIQSIREKINLAIFSSKQVVLSRLKLFSLLISVFALSALVYYYGFPQSASSVRTLQGLIEVSFGFFVLHYVIRVFYDFEPLEYVKRTWFEADIMSFLVIEGLSYNLFDTLLVQEICLLLGMGSGAAVSTIFIQLYLLTVVLVEVFQSTQYIPNLKLNPAAIFALSFVVLIAIGTGLLMMPEMTIAAGGLPFIDALFTSTSASCVTGLIVVDTGTVFSFKGHFVILLLMKLGGLNIVSFAVILAFLSRLGVGFKQHSIIEDFISTDSFTSSKGLLIRILTLSLVIEAVGTTLIYSLITPEMGLHSVGDKLFFALFHSVSAFNNAGFSTLSDGFYSEFAKDAFLIHVVSGALIFAGAIGFTTIFDLFSLRNLRDRLKHPWKNPQLSSRIAINVYIFLIIFGALLFLLLEWNNSLQGMTSVNAIITAIFQSISARSAGFNTVDIHNLTMPVIILLLFLMFVGGSTYSTAGGIKTSTFALLLLSAFSTIKGKKNLEVYKRSVPNDDLLKAYAVFLFNIGGVLLGIFLLSITESHILEMPDRNIIDLVFEQVSAFSTCGLSTGITGLLSTSGKTIIVLSMFVGRIGTLTVAFALSKTASTTNYKYPEEHIMVG